nr:site-specific integrase [Azospirillum sp. SYSU D00513]
MRGFFIEVWPIGTITFYVRYRDPRGRGREMRIGRLGEITADQARKKAQEIKAQARLGGDPAGERDKLKAMPTFSAFMENSYLPFVKERIRSHVDHESFYRVRLKARWGNRRMDEIKPHDVATLQDSLRKDGLANGTVNRYTAFVRRVFNLAIEWEVIEGRNPARKAEMRREHHREKFLTEAELRALFLALLAATGARRSEAMKAKWEHVDFERRLWVVPVAKSGRRRHIPLSDMAVRILVRQPRPPGCPWVFPGQSRKKHIGCLRNAWLSVKKRVGLPDDLRLHDLRHTFASTLVSKGRTLYEVSQLLGHSQMSMTMRYAHLAPQRLLEAANEALPEFSEPPEN